MFVPHGPHHCRIENLILAEFALTQQALGPVAQRAAQPDVDRHTETHLWSINEFARHVFVQHLAEDPFAVTVALLVAKRQRPGKLNYSMIKQWAAGFKADTHAGTIDLYQN